MYHYSCSVLIDWEVVYPSVHKAKIVLSEPVTAIFENLTSPQA
jgi:hypothetical protein